IQALAELGGPEEIGRRERQLARQLWEGLSEIPGVRLYGPADFSQRVAVVSFTVEGRTVSEVGGRLDEEFGILARVGLHCAPVAHRTLGTFPQGTVRLSPGPFNTPEQIARAVAAVRRLAEGA
ncbi:aminotransferase class V-fold PLP-dependent enzyme, partial [Symbiobacterium thermophilum]